MAKFRFTGQYTNGHTSISTGGVTFTGHEPTDVDDKDLIARLRGHPEFEAVDGRTKAAKASSDGE